LFSQGRLVNAVPLCFAAGWGCLWALPCDITVAPGDAYLPDGFSIQLAEGISHSVPDHCLAATDNSLKTFRQVTLSAQTFLYV
ncbi:MAG: hypothetical protein IKM70_06860, partial [Firmicutes bacterium]|nr:hypothetical protein [Bacillota bacterium]